MKKLCAAVFFLLLFSFQLFSHSRIADLHYQRAIYYYKKNNFSGCVIQLLNVIRNRNTSQRLELLTKSLLLLGKSYNYLGNYNSAEFYLYQVFKNTPINKYYKEALLEIAKTFTLAKKYKKAYEVYQYIEDRFTEQNYLSEAVFQKGELALVLQDSARAIDYFKKIVFDYRNTHRYNDALMRLRQLGYIREGSRLSTQAPEQIYRPRPQQQIPIERIPEPVGLSPEERQAIDAAHAQGQQTIAQAQSQQQTTALPQTTTTQQAASQQTGTGQQQTTQQPATATGTGQQQTGTQTTAASQTTGQQTTPQNTTTGQQTVQVQPQPQNSGMGRTIPAEPVQETPPPRMPDISFPSSRSYYPAEQSFSDRLRTDFLRGITNLSERDIQKLEARLRLLEERERELARIQKELQAFYHLLKTKDKILLLKAQALDTMRNQLTIKEQKILQLIKLQSEGQRTQPAPSAAGTRTTGNTSTRGS